jgi:UDP-N-acetylglucosamine diphosphorylase / glucose-1-phosphate thymidylyltransferase / UDP-N-acetylgalactosamine diphosphorylase / glucosamine-1-phosphate N-acetyltransferase / galactosamine-1-phosphate N-acetyltransferase
MVNTISIQEYFDLNGLSFSDIFKNITFPWEALSRISDYLELQINQKNTPANLTKKNNVLIGKGTIIDKGAVIKGRVIIGENCFVESASLIRGDCIIGDNVQIGHGVELKHSIVLNNSSIAHLNYVGDSIIGNNVNISGGAIVANFRLDKGEIAVNIEGQKINTELIKFGAIIGDGSVIGVNSVLNPGTILGKNCIVYPLTSVRGTHKSNEVIK